MQSIQSLSMQLSRAASMSQDEMSDPRSTLDSLGQQQNSTNKLSRLVSKKATRVKELVLQNFGKSDKTIDQIFQVYEENFHKQQAHALKLQREFKLYMVGLKGAQEASKTLNCCIQQSTGDYQSARHDLVCENLSQLEHLNEDLMDKLRTQVMSSINEYLSQFNELRNKIAKRRRKQIDFDSSRRVYELMLSQVNKKRLQLQQQHSPTQSSQTLRPGFLFGQRQGDSVHSATSQLVDEARLLKVREQYNYCKIMYETINNELHEELPMVYDRKMKHLLMTLQNYFSLEAQFHSNAGKLFATASDVIDELPMSALHAHHHVRAHSLDEQIDEAEAAGGEYGKPCSGSSGMGSSRGESSLESSSSPEASDSGTPTSDHPQRPIELVDEAELEEDEEEEGPLAEIEELSCGGQDLVAPLECVSSGKEAAMDVLEGSPDDHAERLSGTSEDAVLAENEENQVTEVELKASTEPLELNGPSDEVNSEEPAASHSEPKVGKLDSKRGHSVLYKVRACYKYMAEDVDELCFEADEIIQVIELDEAHEQEEGWLIGLRELNGQIGLFPANFTRPL